jgi:hypothetical protein
MDHPIPFLTPFVIIDRGRYFYLLNRSHSVISSNQQLWICSSNVVKPLTSIFTHLRYSVSRCHHWQWEILLITTSKFRGAEMSIALLLAIMLYIHQTMAEHTTWLSPRATDSRRQMINVNSIIEWMNLLSFTTKMACTYHSLSLVVFFTHDISLKLFLHCFIISHFGTSQAILFSVSVTDYLSGKPGSPCINKPVYLQTAMAKCTSFD